MKYLLDTDIIIFFFKGKFNIADKMLKVGISNCFISEITLAELKFGAANSSNREKHDKEIEELIKSISILPIISGLDVFADEKTRLRKAGTPIDDFDLLIGSTAVADGLTMVTNNVRHFEKFSNIIIENWTIEDDSFSETAGN